MGIIVVDLFSTLDGVYQAPRAFPKGAVWLAYERAGDLVTGVDIEAERTLT